MAQMRMEIKQCSKGHFYSGEHEECPFCAGSVDQERVDPEWEMSPNTEVKSTAERIDLPRTDKWENPFAVEDYEVTMYSGYPGMETMGCDPVVGWLVCTKGPNRGQAYRLHGGTNFIGRGEKMDVCIENDKQISSRNAASISYDDRTKVFFLERGDGRNNIYLNGSVLRRAEDVVRYDQIVIGGSEFLFIPLCGENFDWRTEDA